ncbi:MAG: 50S ribosomal protein L22 [Candidatus Pacearchaeota archaeon]|nr:50S ribosomal protein L22 [Candidatus Pacearchaeota archaeon]
MEEKQKIKIEEKEEANKKEVKTMIVRGLDLPVSTKHAIAVCRFIKGKNPYEAIALLEKVIKKKIAVPMKGEIPHRKNMPKGKVAGRYPSKASKEFVKLIKNLIANASTKGINAEDIVISVAKADKASRPYRPTRIAYGRKRFKRSHVLLEATLKEKFKEKKLKRESQEINKKND